MAFSFDKRAQTVNQAEVERIEANRARMAEESRVISEICSLLRKGASVEEASSQVEGATVEQINAWMAEGRITDPKYFKLPYRATDQDLH